MTIIIEHYPRRHPAMTALIRGAFQDWSFKSAAAAQHGGKHSFRWGVEPGFTQPSKLLLIHPEGKVLTTPFLKERRLLTLPPPPPLSSTLSLSLSVSLSPLSLHPYLCPIKITYAQEGHLHKLRRINKREELWITGYLRGFCLLATSHRCKVGRKCEWARNLINAAFYSFRFSLLPSRWSLF